MNNNMKDKFLLTIPEASKYFNIGEVRLRKYVNQHLDENWWMAIGPRKMIKREMFEDYLKTIRTM